MQFRMPGPDMTDAQVLAATTLEEVGWEFAPGDEVVRNRCAVARLGDGQRTESWLAWDRNRWAAVVVKIVRPSHLQSDNALASLRREASAHQALRHPSVQRLLDDGTEDERPHLVTEYIQGPSLADLRATHGALMTVDVVRFGLHIASALHHLHGGGLLHLDLKPGNVVVRAGHAIVIDLGCVRPVGWAPEDGYPRGSRPYMAPEQCRCEAADERTDLFALGTVLYEAASGEPAFCSTDECFEQLERPASRPKDRNTAVSTSLDEVICALLERDPANRPGSSAEVLAALDAALPPGEDPVWPSFVTPLTSTP